MNTISKFDVSPVEGAIRNPDNPHHFMVLKPVNHLVKIFRGDELLAKTNNALRVIEIGKSVYDPILYIPTKDVIASLTRTEKTSHCPLKGNATYFEFTGEEIAWSYSRPFDFAKELRDHHAFWSSKIRIEEGE